jgi:DNA-binding SARP family transcriptional activator
MPSRRRSPNPDLVWDWVLQPLVLLALPIALWKLTGNPIPSRWWSLDDIRTWWASVQMYPSQALDILPRILVDALWIGWAWYTAWLTLALLWTLVHLPAVLMPRILLRLTPRTTVQAITVGAVAATPAAHAAPAPMHTTAAAAPLPANLNGRLHLTATPASTRTQHLGYPLSALNHPALRDAREHHVVKGDTLWDLAVHYYGDGEQWKRIFAGNIGRPQPDGRYLTNPDLILPGWTLTIPHRTTPDPASAAPGPNTATPPPTASAPNGNRAPATTAPGGAVGRPTAPGTGTIPTPARTGATAPGNNGDAGARRPAPDPHTPHTVGWHLPDGGYIGITLIAAVAVSVALLKTRQRLHPDTTPPIPQAAADLAAVHDAAKQVHTHGRASKQSHGEVPPPVFKPQPGVSMLGTYPSGRDEAWYDPGLQSGPLVFDGPGAQDAVRALALSLLGATDLELDLEPEISPLGLQVVLIDKELAAELFGATPKQHLPGWLHLTDTPQAAVAAFHAAARRHAQAGVDAEQFMATDEDPYTVLIARTDPALHDAIVEACLMDPTASLGAVLLGAAPHGPNSTLITVAQDGATQDVTGPRVGEVRGIRLYHLHRQRAGELFQVLYATRAVYHQPPSEPDAPIPPHDPAPREDTALEAETPPQPKAGPAPHSAEPDAPTGPTTNDPLTLATTPVLLRVLGPIDVLGPGTALSARGDRTCALLTLLALKPDGQRATELADLAWDEPSPRERQRKKAVYSALDRVRELLRTATGETTTAQNDSDQARDPIPNDPAGRYRLDPQQITTDLALQIRLEDEAAHATDPTERLRLLAHAAALYRGTLADGLDDNHRDWLTTARYNALQHAVDLHTRIAELTADTEPGTALHHLTTATDLAPDDETTVATAIRLYHQLGRPDLARALQQRPTA